MLLSVQKPLYEFLWCEAQISFSLISQLDLQLIKEYLLLVSQWHSHFIISNRIEYSQKFTHLHEFITIVKLKHRLAKRRRLYHFCQPYA